MSKHYQDWKNKLLEKKKELLDELEELPEEIVFDPWSPIIIPEESDIPTDEEIMTWVAEDGGCYTDCPDACWVEPDGICPHEYSSWAMVRGLL